MAVEDTARSSMSPRGPLIGGEPISPELALVSEELAAAARLLLPERPWEAFAPPLPVEPLPSPGPVRLRPRLALRVAAPRVGVPRYVAPVPEPAAPAAVLPLPAPPAGRPVSPPARRLAAKVLVGTAVFLGVAHLGAWESGGERLLDANDQPPTQATPPPAPSAVGARPYPQARYVVDGESGFDTDAAARAILRFRLPVDCGAPLVVPRAPLRPDGTFSFSGTLREGSVQVNVDGTFVSRGVVKGVVRVWGGGCSGETTPYTGRVS